MGQPQEPPRQRDVFRESLLRYVAFTSDLGEACKPFISRRVYLGSYAIVAIYGLADTLDKGRSAYKRTAGTARAPLAAHPQAQIVPPAIPASPAPAPAAAPASAPLAASSAVLPFASRTATALHRSATAAVACAACLPPPTAYQAGSAAERPVAVPVAAAMLDTALWHTAASLVIPGVAINRTVWAAESLLATASWAARLHPRVRQLSPSAAGLALIPLLVPHIDEAVTEWMEAHVRPRLPQGALPEATQHSPSELHEQ